MILSQKKRGGSWEVMREAETWSDERRTCGVTIRIEPGSVWLEPMRPGRVSSKFKLTYSRDGE